MKEKERRMKRKRRRRRNQNLKKRLPRKRGMHIRNIKL